MTLMKLKNLLQSFIESYETLIMLTLARQVQCPKCLKKTAAKPPDQVYTNLAFDLSEVGRREYKEVFWQCRNPNCMALYSLYWYYTGPKFWPPLT